MICFGFVNQCHSMLNQYYNFDRVLSPVRSQVLHDGLATYITLVPHCCMVSNEPSPQLRRRTHAGPSKTQQSSRRKTHKEQLHVPGAQGRRRRANGIELTSSTRNQRPAFRYHFQRLSTRTSRRAKWYPEKRLSNVKALR